MLRQTAGAFALIALGLACGGGGTTTPDFGPSPDQGGDAKDAPDLGEVVEDAVEAADEIGFEPDEIGGEDVVVEDEGVVAQDEGVSTEFADVSDVSLDEGTEEPGEVVQPECPCEEPAEPHWVCGIDGNDYKSDQCAKCAICKDGPNRAGCMGDKECDPADPLGPNGWMKQKAKCEVCVCDDQDECTGKFGMDAPCGPFCSMDGQTFQTACDMKKFYGCSDDWDENVKSLGECHAEVCEGCEGEPVIEVCGTDGETYPNYCTLQNCPKNDGAQLDYPGHCLGPDYCPDCVSEDKPGVCGQDMVTYANECAAKCKGVDVAHPGACCLDCPADGPGVCGADFKTYPNECILMCLGIAKMYDGECECNCDVSPPKVCGEDGKTYPNQCWLDCKGVKKLHDGPCEGPCAQCPTNIDPVCGKDDKTYQNQCFLDCLTQGVASSSSIRGSVRAVRTCAGTPSTCPPRK